jgi:magnesium transporter
MKDIKTKILKGDFSSLLESEGNKQLIHPNDVAQLVATLPNEYAVQSFIALSKVTQTVVFAYLSFDKQLLVIKGISKDRGSDILNHLPSDDRFSFFSNLVGIEQSYFLEYLSEKNRKETHDFLGYPSNSIARLINTDFSAIAQKMTIGDAIAHLRSLHNDTEAINVIYVIDENGVLVDDIPIRKLILNDPQKTIESILDGFCVALNIRDVKEIAIDKFKEYDRDVLPVVNDKNILIGVLTADDVLDIAEQRDTEDIQKFGGLESLDFPYVKTPLFSLIKKRAGWLIVLFVSEMLTASAMGYFDEEISKAVVLALFIPLIISSGGNSGSQAATLIIRAMALKEITFKDWWFVMKRELLSGLVLGIMLGAIGLFRIVLWQQFHWFDYTEHYLLVGITIFFSLIGIVTWGTISGSMIPILLKKAGFDPATSSAPFVATLVDVTGLIIYFSIAAVLLKGTLL